MEVSGQLQALAILLLGKNPWFPLNRRLLVRCFMDNFAEFESVVEKLLNKLV
jgi:hypothetical protein